MRWTVEKDRELRSLRDDEKLSYRAIAAHLSKKWSVTLTKSAVQGRYTRLYGVSNLSAMHPDYSEQIASAKAMRAAGANWREISDRLGVPINSIRHRADPEFRARALAKDKIRRDRIAAGLHTPKDMHIVRDGHGPRNPVFDPKRDGVREPQSLTAFLLGDPWPGRNEIMRRAG
jgi:hypothetical protein